MIPKYSMHWNRAGLVLAKWEVQKARAIRLSRRPDWRRLHARQLLCAAIERQAARRLSWV
jgi:hypothetical protein